MITGVYESDYSLRNGLRSIIKAGIENKQRIRLKTLDGKLYTIQGHPTVGTDYISFKPRGLSMLELVIPFSNIAEAMRLQGEAKTQEGE